MSTRAVLIASMVLLSGGVFAQRPAPNAFIDHRCTTVSELVAECKNNPDVLDRFSRHFAMSHEDVIRYVSSLHVSRLKRTGVYTVYSIPPGGYVKMHAEKLERGTPVFADMNDTPVLMVKCGNPLTLGPNVPAVAVVPAVQPVAPMHGEEIVAEVVPAPPVFAAPVPAAPIVAAAPAPQVPVGGAVFPWPLLLLPLGFIHGGHGGGGGAPVPEPTSLLVIGVGVAAMFGRRALARR